MKGYVYLITRKDGEQYIGITYNVNKRVSAHKKTKRFEIGIENVEILKECEKYEDAEMIEHHYIEEYDTFYNGLNNSIDGKGNHLSENFTTKGYKFSKETREKMRKNHWSKTGKYKPTGKKHTEETKKTLSEIRKGKSWGPRKIDRDDALMILENFRKDLLDFDTDFIIQFVKKSDRERVGKVGIEELKAPNGKFLNKIVLYSEHYSKIYGVTKQAIIGILKNGISEDAI